jgi:hypothetical protein
MSRFAGEPDHPCNGKVASPSDGSQLPGELDISSISSLPTAASGGQPAVTAGSRRTASLPCKDSIQDESKRQDVRSARLY